MSIYIATVGLWIIPLSYIILMRRVNKRGISMGRFLEIFVPVSMFTAAILLTIALVVKEF